MINPEKDAPVGSFAPRRMLWPAGAICFFYAVIVSLLALARLNTFKLHIGDTATFGQAILSILGSNSMMMTWHSSFFGTDAEVNFMANHFMPILFMIAPAFWVIPVIPGLVVLKCVLIASAGFILFLISHRAAGPAVAFFVMTLFLASPNMMSVIHDSFHGDYIAPLFFFSGYYCLMRGSEGVSDGGANKRSFALALICFFLFMMSKETFAVHVAGLGIYFLIIRRELVRGSILLGLAAAYAVFAFGMLSFFQSAYSMDHAVSWKSAGVDRILGLELNPFALEYRPYLTYFLEDLKILSLFHPMALFWIPGMLIYVILGLPLGDHYGTVITALIFLSYPFIFRHILQRYRGRIAPLVMAVLIVIMAAPSWRKSVKVLNPKHYVNNPLIADQKYVIAHIPAGASVTVPELYSVHLFPRRYLDWIGHSEHRRSYEYVLLDTNPQNISESEMSEIRAHWLPLVRDSGSYELVASRNQIELYKRIDA